MAPLWPHWPHSTCFILAITRCWPYDPTGVGAGTGVIMQIRAGPLSLGKGQSIMQMRGCRFRPFQRCNIVETETTNRDGGEGEGGKGKWNRLIINILHSFFRFFFFFFFFFFFISNGKIYRSSATNDPVSSGQCPISPHCHPFPGSIPPGPKRPPFLSFFLS